MNRLNLLLIVTSSAALIAACSQPETAVPANDGAGGDTGDTMMADGMNQEGMGSGSMGHEGENRSETSPDSDATDHAAMDHNAMGQGAMGMAATEASAHGVLNEINAANGSVNITHPPMPEIGWPEMTMDMPVTGRVDLLAYAEGDAVAFTVRRGRDDVYRIVAMQPSSGGE